MTVAYFVSLTLVEFFFFASYIVAIESVTHMIVFSSKNKHSVSMP